MSASKRSREMKRRSSSIRRVSSSAGPGYGYPEGHLGHLNEVEEQALRDFKVFLEEKGLWTPGPPPSHDDPTLLRFLRARKWVVQDAYHQFSETEKFRNSNQIETLYDTIDIDAYETSKRLYPMWTGRRDRRGIPIYVYQIRHLDASTVAKYEKSTDTTYSSAKTDGKTPAKLLRLFALYENLTRFAQPLCTECRDRDYPETPITLSTNIVDVSHVSLRMFWNLKSHMQAASQLATAHYPETLDRIFIIGAPIFFTTVWSWIKRWFDPVTVSKIFVLSPNEAFPVLSSFIDIQNLPKSYGGELDWTFFDEPNFDDEVKRLMRWENGNTQLPPGPQYWRVDPEDESRLELVAVGSKNKEHRMERVATIPRHAFHKGSDQSTSTDTDVTVVESPAADETPFVTPMGSPDMQKPIMNGNGFLPAKLATEAPTVGMQNLSVAGGNETRQPAELSEKIMPNESVPPQEAAIATP